MKSHKIFVFCHVLHINFFST